MNGISDFVRNIVSTLGRQVFSGLLQLLIITLIVRYYGAEGNGIYTLTLLLPLMLATFLNFGVGAANVYFVNSGKIIFIQAVRNTINFYFLFVLCGELIGFLVIFFLGEIFFDEVPLKFLLLSLIIFPLTLLLEFISSLFQALQRFSVFNLILLVQPIIMVVGVAALYISGLSKLDFLLWLYVLSLCVTLLLSIYLIGKEVCFDDVFKCYSISLDIEMLNYGFRAHLSNVVTFFNYRIDLLIVNFYLGPALLGVYVVSVQLAEKLWILSSAVSTVLMPKLAELSNDTNSSASVTPVVCRWVILLTLIGAFILLFLSHAFISLAFGIEFSNAFDVLIYLVPGVVFWAGSRVISNDLAAHGILKVNLYSSIIVLLINVFLNVLLIPIYSLVGAAVATTVSYTFDFLIKVVYYKRIRSISVISLIFPAKEDFTFLYNLIKNKVKTHYN
jgi:O-antigen/teichoic acid export membrane protein